jgi:hypothetical protein
VWRSVEECGGVWRSVEECGGVWRSVEECGGVWRSVEECGGVWRGGLRHTEWLRDMVVTQQIPKHTWKEKEKRRLLSSNGVFRVFECQKENKNDKQNTYFMKNNMFLHTCDITVITKSKAKGGGGIGRPLKLKKVEKSRKKESRRELTGYLAEYRCRVLLIYPRFPPVLAHPLLILNISQHRHHPTWGSWQRATRLAGLMQPSMQSTFDSMAFNSCSAFTGSTKTERMIGCSGAMKYVLQ